MACARERKEQRKVGKGVANVCQLINHACIEFIIGGLDCIDGIDEVGYWISRVIRSRMMCIVNLMFRAKADDEESESESESEAFNGASRRFERRSLRGTVASDSMRERLTCCPISSSVPGLAWLWPLGWHGEAAYSDSRHIIFWLPTNPYQSNPYHTILYLPLPFPLPMPLALSHSHPKKTTTPPFALNSSAQGNE